MKATNILELYIVFYFNFLIHLKWLYKVFLISMVEMLFPQIKQTPVTDFLGKSLIMLLDSSVSHSAGEGWHR